MKFTYYGQSCCLIETGGKKILFDPFIRQNPLAAHIDAGSIEAEYILLSHAHGDHIADLAEIAATTGAQVITIVETAKWLTKQGVKNVTGVNFGPQTFAFGKMRTVWAVHTSAAPDGSYGGNPAGFVLELEGKKIYFAGDTALTLEMKLLADLYKLDYAILPIGGYYTMDVDDALIATKYLACDTVIGVHYDSFPEIEIDKKDAISKFTRESKRLILMDVGEEIEL